MPMVGGPKSACAGIKLVRSADGGPGVVPAGAGTIPI